MKKVLVTGGAGFIGSQLGYYLHNKGYEVILLDNMSYGNEDNLVVNGETFGTFIKDDVRNESIFEHTKDVDYVYHLAAEYGRWNGEDFYEDFDINPDISIRENGLEKGMLVKQSITQDKNKYYLRIYMMCIKSPSRPYKNDSIHRVR